MKIDFYKELINKLNPLDESEFMYNTKTWNKLNSELKNNLTIFEDKSISRSMVVDSFKSYFNGNTDFSLPFVLTMIWGFADTGYGTYRTNNYYESNENQNFMKNAFKYVSQCEIEKAYKELQKIKGLNISYISKLLYFSTKACGYQDYCLIYDIRVAKSLVKLTCPPEIYEILDIKPSNKYIHYSKYNVLMHKIANDNGVSPEALEMFLFKQEF
ncbi:8-oxoguanine DNA glycosylase OGG fold protein [Chryseobacterium wangxinyae]|uniref:8-oxoguanine DNA glycosylase OGG fold protein n=1 Tax=Chryseobacterium sp. CY353 TaxID=2997334 RepID=UPI00227140DD|nr:hypothetical protein [Chryseobacterium sp. CY353]MCY0968554.1 hypothetical protein [Chryseobacterium sp. CY353]